MLLIKAVFSCAGVFAARIRPTRSHRTIFRCSRFELFRMSQKKAGVGMNGSTIPGIKPPDIVCLLPARTDACGIPSGAMASRGIDQCPCGGRTQTGAALQVGTLGGQEVAQLVEKGFVVFAACSQFQLCALDQCKCGGLEVADLLLGTGLLAFDRIMIGLEVIHPGLDQGRIGMLLVSV